MGGAFQLDVPDDEGALPKIFDQFLNVHIDFTSIIYVFACGTRAPARPQPRSGAPI